MAWTKYALTTLFGTNTTQTATQLIIQKSNLTPYGLTASSNNKAEQLLAALAIRMVAIAPIRAGYLLQCSRWGQLYPADKFGQRWTNDIITISFNFNPIKEPLTLFNPNDIF